MQGYTEALIVVLVIVVIGYVVMYQPGAGDGGVVGETYSWVDGGSESAAGASPGRCPSLSEQAASHRAFLNERLACRTGVPNHAAGWGAQKPPHPHDRVAAADTRDRNGHYLPAAKVARAEQEAWAPYDPHATSTFDVAKGIYPGDDLTQQLGNYQEGDWGEDVSHHVIDARTRENHRQWANEVGPHSMGAMTVDNMDEAVAMSLPRQGITAFRALTPAQSVGTLHVTEIGPEDHAEQFKKMYF
jgi:hypothetical protein